MKVQESLKDTEINLIASESSVIKCHSPLLMAENLITWSR
jgi:hypothetical protein